MKKSFKIVGIVAGVLIGLLVVAAIALSLLFDPNQYRDDVIRLVKNKTGRDLQISKKIGWSFFPRLGIEAGGLALSNAPGFGSDPFARIDAAGVHVAVLPLLRGKVQVDSIYVNGMALNLARDRNGRSNWADLASGGSSDKPAPAEPASSEPTRLPVEGLAIGALDIRRTTIDWQDAASGSHYTVRDLNLTTSRFASGVPMDFKVGFDLIRPAAPATRIRIKSRLTAKPDSLNLAKLDFKLDDSHLTGSIDIRNFSSPALRFDLALDQLNLDRYLGNAGGPAAAPADAGKQSKPAASPADPNAGLRLLNIDGKLAIKSLTAFGAKLTDARLGLKAKDGLISVSPSEAKLYGGTYHGQPTIDARGQVLRIALNEKVENVQVGPLLKDMKIFDSYTGVGNIKLDFKSAGTDAKAVKKNLNGQASIALRDGRIEGVDLAKMIETARALRKKSAGAAVEVATQNQDSTVFKALTADARVTNGVARTDNIVLDGANLRGTGKGSADLVNERLDFALRLTVAGGADRKGETVPVKVKGPFSKPKYQVDLAEYMKMGVEKQIEKNLGKGLERLLAPKKSRKQQLREQQQ